jgi:hypothetical protein
MKLSDLRRLHPRKVPPVVKPLVLAPIVTERLPMKVSAAAVALALQKPDPFDRGEAFRTLFPPAPMPPRVREAMGEKTAMAMDNAVTPIYEFAGMFGYGGYGDFELWPGFPILAELTQRPEYRAITETRAKEMTRKWIKLTYQGEKVDKDKLEQIESAMEAFKVRDLFRIAAEHDGFFGGGQIYIDTGASDRPDLLKKPLVISEKTIPKGGLKGLIVIEPMWSYPGYYNSTDPLKANYFSPDTWYVMNKVVHHTRLLTMISAEVPDILKPNYSFRGVSMSQRAMPYVQNWLRTRQSVSDLLHSFSIVVLKTVMQAQLAGDAWNSVFARVDVFNATRDNRGAMVIDKETEEMDVLAVPLGTLDKLQDQSLEQLSVVSRIPMIKWAGITPGGLNGGGEDEIRVFYDDIHAQQEHLFADPLKRIIDIVQLHLFGKIDPSVGFKFIPLWELDEAGEALVQKARADTHAIYVQEGVVSNEEVRTTLAEDEHSPYFGLDMDPEDVPDPPEMEQPPEGTSGDPATKAETRAQSRSGV